LLTDRAPIDAAAHSADTVPVDSLALISPVTAPCRVVAQMTKYVSHVKGAGMDPKSIPLAFFRKASGSNSGPFDEIIKPQHVKLLDYEVEIGLVIGRDIPVGTELAESSLADFIAGLVVTNDVSARDVQLTKTQFYEAKSYPTFTPVGPALGAPPKPVASLLPPAVKWKAFFKRQAPDPKYLQHGDIVELSVATDDGAIDLGSQRTAVRYA
jgi:2-keto-4-pentenoate hydratase/2-oxohepta-3-ene-1,7-dioic acid hydratase in catechol pathway